MSFKTFLSGSAARLHEWYDNNLKPWMQQTVDSLIHAEVAAVLPIASAAAAKIAGDLATSNGNISSFGSLVDKVWDETVDQMKVAGITAAGTSLLQAVSTAVAVHVAALPLGGTAAPADPAPHPDALKTDGPTIEEYAAAGYDPAGYPPQGYAAKPFTDEQKAAAQATFAAKHQQS